MSESALLFIYLVKASHREFDVCDMAHAMSSFSCFAMASL